MRKVRLNSLYFCYDGLLDALGQSQVLPYIYSLVELGHKFTIISYEKKHRKKSELLDLQNKLNDIGIDWKRVKFSKGKISFLKNVISGIYWIRKISINKQIDIVHLRGLQAAIIYKLSLSKTPHIYDIRAFFGEWVDIAKVKKNTLSYIVLKFLDKLAVETASGLVVLEENGKNLLKKLYKIPDIPVQAIRTCTDISRYKQKNINSLQKFKSPIRLVFLGGARLPYRTDLAFVIVSEFLKSGIDCYIDFINENDHDHILKIADKTGFPEEKMKLFQLSQERIPQALQNYNCGLILNNTSVSRRVSSPTKLGEYLAAGIPVISLEGIDVVDKFADISPCVAVIKKNEFLDEFSKELINKLTNLIYNPEVSSACQKLAADEFDLSNAVQLYSQFYLEILKNNKIIKEKYKRKILYISYDGLLDPLGHSQVLPYIYNLTKYDYIFTIISFEKKIKNNKRFNELNNLLIQNKIEWHPLNYYSLPGFLRLPFNLFKGSFELKSLIKQKKINLIHFRGFLSGIIYFLSFKKIKFIYDFRSFAVDEYVEMKKIKLNSFRYRIFRKIDNYLLKNTSGLVVLEKVALKIINRKNQLNTKNIKIIRTSLDIRRFIDEKRIIKNKKNLDVVYLGDANDPYRIDWALKFVNEISIYFDTTNFTFINYSNHDTIHRELKNHNLNSNLRIICKRLLHSEIFNKLPNYDLGLCFLNPTPSRYACSPTKIGEYLAAGMPIVSNHGIAILEYLEKKYNCVRNIKITNNNLDVNNINLKEIIDLTFNKETKKRCIYAAEKEYGINEAVSKYDQLYKKILN